MKPALVDVPVLILFFNRPQQLSQVFEQVKKARPSRLFLYQDGARNEHDLPGIKACREIVSQIDWECEVERFYQEKNFGCDPSEYISQKWAFSKVDKCIVLEDDDVPSVSFFRFCKEMLDKYEHDTRISMIAGFNPEEIRHPLRLFLRHHLLYLGVGKLETCRRPMGRVLYFSGRLLQYAATRTTHQRTQVPERLHLYVPASSRTPEGFLRNHFPCLHTVQLRTEHCAHTQHD